MDYVRKVGKRANGKNVERLSQKLPQKKVTYPYPDQETFDKIIRESLLADSDPQDEDTKPASNWLSVELESQKSSAQQSPKKKWKNEFTKSHENSTVNEKVVSKSKKSRAQSKSEKSGTRQSPKKKLKTKSKRSLIGNSSMSQKVKSKSTKSRAQSSKQPSYNWTSLQFLDEATSEKIIGLEIGLPAENADNSKENLQATDGLPESPRKRGRKQNMNEFLITDPYEHVGYRTFGTENDQKVLANHLTFPASEMEKTDEYYGQSDAMEIVPDISFFQVNKSPEPAAKRNPKSNRSRKNVATNSKTIANRHRNAGRNSITDVAEPLEIQCQIDLTTEEEDEPYVLPANVEKFIDIDTLNKNIWEYCKKNFLKSEADFKDVVSVMFTCRYCNQLAVNPVTTPCDHNACLECISNHFSKEIFSCPDCRNDLGRSFKIKENRSLAGALENLFPGYNLRY